MAIPISNVTRRVVYAPSGAGGAGPYAFTFEILANTDIAVFKDDTLLTLTTHYTVTINANGTGSVTITATGLALAPTSPTQYAIVGNRTISRSTDFTTGGDFFANTLNDELDQQTIFAQQNAEGVARALSAPQTDPTTINMTLPRSTLRAGKILTFDSSGNPTAEQVIGSNRGNWASGTSYFVRDLAKDTTTNNVFQVITAHTSSGSLPITTNADSAKWMLLVDAASATTSATNAAASASAASTSASGASTSATNAAASASTASTQASNASTSATNASNSATAASSSATTASTAATNAGNSATSASTSATNASNSATSASGSASTATTQASNASTSATAAAASASTATTQATNASTSASAASTSASNASTSASNASASETAAAASAASAAASFDAFDDIYLGAKASNPTVDNDGNALTTGDQYFNTTANELRVWNGSTWQAASTVGGTVTSLNVTGVASFADGSAAAPSITNDGDTDTGIFYPAANQVAIATNGTQAMLVDASQNVTISSDQISSATSHVASQHAMVLRSATTNQRSIVAVAPNGSGGLADFCISATSDLQTNYNQIRIGSDGTGFFIASEKGGTETTKSLRFGVAGTALTIDTSNNVGIGTSSPSVKFQVDHSSDVAAINASGGGITLKMSNSSANDVLLRMTNNSNNFYDIRNLTSGSAFTIGYNGDERMRIDSSGNVLINSSSGSPWVSSKLFVSAAYSTFTNSDAPILCWNTSTSGTRGLINFRTNAIGTPTGLGGINTDGTNTIYSTTSDYRLKEEIAPMTGALAKVSALKPVTYKWKSNGSDGEGFIAHELAEICPHAVTGAKDAVDLDGNPIHQGIDLSFLVATLTAAIQELKAEFDAYKATHP